jgi:FlgD Ig-like domain
MKKLIMTVALLLVISGSLLAQITAEVESFLSSVEYLTGEVDTIFVSYQITNNDSLAYNLNWLREDLLEEGDGLEVENMRLMCQDDTLACIENPNIVNMINLDLEVGPYSTILLDLALRISGEGFFELQLVELIFTGGLTLNPGLVTDHEVICNSFNFDVEVELFFENQEIVYHGSSVDSIFAGYQFINYGDSVSMIWTRFDLNWDDSLEVHQMRLTCQDDTLAIIENPVQVNMISLPWNFESGGSRELIVSCLVSGFGELSIVLEECIFNNQYTIYPQIQTDHQIIWDPPQSDVQVFLAWIQDEYFYHSTSARANLFDIRFYTNAEIDTVLTFNYEIDHDSDLQLEVLEIIYQEDTLAVVTSFDNPISIPINFEVNMYGKILHFYFQFSGEGVMSTDFLSCDLISGEDLELNIQTDHQIINLYDENNLISNGGFESGVIAPMFIYPWEFEGYFTGAVAYLDSSSVHSGDYSFYVDPNFTGETSQVQLKQEIELEEYYPYWLYYSAQVSEVRDITFNLHRAELVYEDSVIVDTLYHNCGLWQVQSLETGWNSYGPWQFVSNWTGLAFFSVNFGEADIPVRLDDIIISREPPTGADNVNDLVNEVHLSNYPNPFNPQTTIYYGISELSFVELIVYNIKGQKVKQLVDDQFPAGQYSVVWNGKNENGKNVSSGVYFYKMKLGGRYTSTRKMILLK